MAGELDRPDPSALRISDDDRNQVAELLRQAAGEGRLDLDELDERLQAVYDAKTYGDLVPITADLPAHPARSTPSAAVERSRSALVGPSYERSFAMMSETRRQGAWTVPEHHSAGAFMGAVILDLREASFAADVTTIHANAVMAQIDVIVNEHTQVQVDGFGFMGEFTQRRDKVPAAITATSPLVRIKGLALMGSVAVVRKPSSASGPAAPELPAGDS